MAKTQLKINWDYSGNNKTYDLKKYNSVDITYFATLINVWDNRDVLNLSLEKFLSLDTDAYSYGVDYYDENLIIHNYETGASTFLYETASSAQKIAYDTANWINNTNNGADFAIVNNQNPVENLSVYFTNEINTNCINI